MLKKLCIVLGVVAVAATGIAAIPLAHSQGSNRETFTLTSKDSQSHEADIDADNSGGDSPGDYFVGHQPLFRGGRNAGRLIDHCDVIQVGERFFQGRCNGTFHVDGRGNLEVSGVFTFSQHHGGGGGFSITGGTGDFRDASGRMSFVGRQHGSKFTFHVIHN